MNVKLFSAGVALLFFSMLPAQASAADNFLIVFDASGSMTESFSGTSRMSAAKSAVTDLLGSLDSSIKVGLRPYADVAKTGQAEACVQTNMAIPFTADRKAISTKVAALQAVGSYTPTAYALDQAKNDFAPGNNNVLILLTDGKETCGGDGAAAAKALLEAGIKVRTHVIGIAVDAEARAELSAIAQGGGGTYQDATDVATLASSLAKIKEGEKPIDKINTDSELPYTVIRGGNGYDTAVTITPGTYRLDHHQKPGEFDYFKVEGTKEGSEALKIQVATGETGVYFDRTDGTFKELLSTVPYGSFNNAKLSAGYRIMRKDRTQYIQGSVSKASTLASGHSIFLTKGDVFYILIGTPTPDRYTPEQWNGAMAKNASFIITSDRSDDVVATSTAAPTEDIRAKEESATNTDTPTNPSLPAPANSAGMGSTMVYMILALGGLVILGLIILVIKLLMGKRNASAPQMVQEVASNNIPPSNPPTLQ